ncbi:MAG: hypothetical protein LJF06_01140 [Gemmatimonadetes bacterium]|nr:hypothetical protein [Gemmatimonadota bacterium]
MSTRRRAGILHVLAWLLVTSACGSGPTGSGSRFPAAAENAIDAELLEHAHPQVRGTSGLDFARQHLFGPLGIDDVEWWTDECGYYTGGMGLYIRPRDMVKLGSLFLHGGIWQGLSWNGAGVQWSNVIEVIVDGVLPSVRD